MAKVSGVVQTTNEKWETKEGKRLRSPLYSIKVDDEWYGFGFDNPNVQEGEAITFTAEKAKFGKGMDGVASSIERMAAGAPATVAATTKADDRQTSIVYQSQHRDALEAVKFMVEKDIIKLPAKQADKYDVFLGLVQDLTVTWTKEALAPDLSSPTEETAQEADDE